MDHTAISQQQTLCFYWWNCPLLSPSCRDHLLRFSFTNCRKDNLWKEKENGGSCGWPRGIRTVLITMAGCWLKLFIMLEISGPHPECSSRLTFWHPPPHSLPPPINWTQKEEFQCVQMGALSGEGGVWIWRKGDADGVERRAELPCIWSILETLLANWANEESLRKRAFDRA